MNKGKLISVIMPIYNAEDYLRAAIESILKQTYGNIELILVNDGSTDESSEICRSFADRDKRIVFIDKENAGASSARNRGIEAASGDYIGFIDSDDTAEPDMYEYLLTNAEKYRADLVQCATLFDTKESSEVIYSPKKDTVIRGIDSIKRKELKYISPSVWCKLYKKELLDGISFNSDYPIGEDFRFNLECLEKSSCTVFLTDAKYRYIQRESSLCYSPPTERSFTSFRRMLTEAKNDFRLSKSLSVYIKENILSNNADMVSRAVRYRLDSLDEVIRTASREARGGILTVLTAVSISKKDKIKLILLGFAPRLYRGRISKKYS